MRGSGFLSGARVLLVLVLSLVAAPTARAAEPADNVVLFRGFMGIFSLGLDDLAKDLDRRGVRTRVYSHTETGNVVRLLSDPAEKRRGRLVLVGHSFGGNAAMNVARQLRSRNIRVDLVVTLDPTAKGPISENVGRYVNYHFAGHALGSAVVPVSRKSPAIRNIDIAGRKDLVADRVGHWNMTENPRLKKEIVDLVLKALSKR
jgi:hypothetical protein